MISRICFLAVLSLVAACSSHPSESGLEKEFSEHRDAFDALADMAVEDDDYSRISYDFVHPRWELPEGTRPGDLPLARWDSYQEAFRNLDLESGVTNYENDVVVLERSSFGIVPAGSSVGFMRASKLPTSIKLLDNAADLDCALGNEGWCSAAKMLSDDWYMIIERN